MLRPTKKARATGFTLIEILIVISIIVLLIGLLIGGAAMMRKQSQVEQSRVTVNAVAGVLTEYQARVDRVPQYTTGVSYPAIENDPTNPTTFAPSIEFFVVEMKKVAGAKTILQGIEDNFRGNLDGDVDVSGQPLDEIVDTWGNPLRYPPFDDNGTAANPDDDFYGDTTVGLPHQKRPYVASAGADGLWGTFTDDVPDADAADNIYSFEQKQEGAAK